MGATACIVVPWFIPRFEAGTPWSALAWWVHDHLPYSDMTFFAAKGRNCAFNLRWHEKPARRIEALSPRADSSSPSRAARTMPATHILGIPPASRSCDAADRVVPPRFAEGSAEPDIAAVRVPVDLPRSPGSGGRSRATSAALGARPGSGAAPPRTPAASAHPGPAHGRGGEGVGGWGYTSVEAADRQVNRADGNRAGGGQRRCPARPRRRRRAIIRTHHERIRGLHGGLRRLRPHPRPHRGRDHPRLPCRRRRRPSRVDARARRRLRDG